MQGNGQARVAPRKVFLRILRLLVHIAIPTICFAYAFSLVWYKAFLLVAGLVYSLSLTKLRDLR